MKTIIIKEEDYNKEEQAVWERTVIVEYWEHNYEEKIYIIKYKEL